MRFGSLLTEPNFNRSFSILCERDRRDAEHASPKIASSASGLRAPESCALIYRNVHHERGRMAFTMGWHAMEKSHETDEPDNWGYWSVDICVCGATYPQLV
jgi:hypothetical protein